MQTLIFGLQVTVLGIGVVFIALFFLILVIKLMTKGTELSEARQSIGEPALLKKEVVAEDASLSVEDEGEVIAVLATAVACLIQGKQMRVKTIRRNKEEKVSAWSVAGRQETMYGRQTR